MSAAGDRGARYIKELMSKDQIGKDHMIKDDVTSTVPTKSHHHDGFFDPDTPVSFTSNSRAGWQSLCYQKSALPGVRGKAITSRTLPTPVTYDTSRSKPRPKPACGTVP